MLADVGDLKIVMARAVIELAMAMKIRSSPVEQRSTVRKQIEKHFDFAFRDHHFQFIFERHFESFGNWVVVLRSDDCRVRLFQDRGELSVAVGPTWSPPGWQAGPWYGLAVVTAFLTRGEFIFQPEKGNTERQIQHAARAFRLYCEQICELFQGKTYMRNRPGLDRLQEQMLQQLWDGLGTAGAAE